MIDKIEHTAIANQELAWPVKNDPVTVLMAPVLMAGVMSGQSRRFGLSGFRTGRDGCANDIILLCIVLIRRVITGKLGHSKYEFRKYTTLFLKFNIKLFLEIDSSKKPWKSDRLRLSPTGSLWYLTCKLSITNEVISRFCSKILKIKNPWRRSNVEKQI